MESKEIEDALFTVEDRTAKRLPVAIALSAAANLLFLVGASAMIRSEQTVPEIPTAYITIESLKPAPSPVAKKQPIKQVAVSKPRPTPVAPKPVATPKPVVTPVPVAQTTPPPKRATTLPVAPAVKTKPVAKTSAPQDSHNRVLVAKSSGAPKHDDFVARSGGNARAGQIMARQAEGNGMVNTVTPVPAPRETTAPAPAPEPTRQPEPPQPTPEPPAPKATPAPPPPRPVGPTRDPVALHKETPDIPDSLRDSDFKSSVQVRVDVREDGSFSVDLKTSSGNPEIDQNVIKALKRWKWKPALKEGEPVAMPITFTFNFSVD